MRSFVGCALRRSARAGTHSVIRGVLYWELRKTAIPMTYSLAYSRMSLTLLRLNCKTCNYQRSGIPVSPLPASAFVSYLPLHIKYVCSCTRSTANPSSLGLLALNRVIEQKVFIQVSSNCSPLSCYLDPNYYSGQTTLVLHPRTLAFTKDIWN